MIPKNTKITITPNCVIYRIHRTTGILVVKVFCYDTTPRITFYMETLSDIYPTPLFIEEINDFIEDAKHKMKGEKMD
jgi:hypothetical protein